MESLWSFVIIFGQVAAVALGAFLVVAATVAAARAVRRARRRSTVPASAEDDQHTLSRHQPGL